MDNDVDGHMTAPAVIWDGVGKRVLTLEWATGMPMTDPAAAEQPGLDSNALADNVVRAFLTQALDHGTFHADLHEGNLFCQRAGRADGDRFRHRRPAGRRPSGAIWPRSCGAS